MGFLRSQVAQRGNPEATNSTTGVGGKPQENFPGKQFKHTEGVANEGVVKILAGLVGTEMGPPKMEARDLGLQYPEEKTRMHTVAPWASPCSFHLFVCLFIHVCMC